MAADLDRFRQLLDITTDKGHTFEARCPAHTDNHASLSVSVGDEGGTVLHCHAGCSAEAVVAALGLSMADLAATPHVVARYAYVSPDGAVLWVIDRWAPKDFRAVPGLPVAAERVPYNLPDVIRAVKAGTTVYVVEGERDVETLRGHGFVGTCNVGGAGKWLAHYSQWLVGADVVIIADDDGPGIAHARAVYVSLVDLAAMVTIRRPLYGKDVTELLAAGFGINHTEPLSATNADMGGHLLSVVRSRVVEWAWQGFIPYGAITVIDGDPGEGKSTLTCDLVARWSSGAPMPDGSAATDRNGVVMYSAEDDEETTIGPRLIAAGARASNVLLMSDTSDSDAFILSTDALNVLGQYLLSHQQCGQVVIDPLSAFWEAGVNSYVDADVRAALRPLSRLARTYNVAVLLVRHLTKSATTALYAGSGSIGIIGAARAGFMVRSHHADDRLRIFAATKSNLAVMPPVLAYRLVPTDAGVAKVQWEDAPADTTSAKSMFASAPPASLRGQAEQWIMSQLDGVYLAGSVMLARSNALGLWSKKTLEDARAALSAANRIHLAVNPSVDGTLTPGKFWHVVGQLPPAIATDSDGLRAIATATPIGAPVANTRTAPTDSDGGAADDHADFDQRPLVCDVCHLAPTDAEPVIRWAKPWWVIRCMAHNPRTYTP